MVRLLSLLSLALPLASAASSVLDLIPSNFDKVVFESNKPSLVEFFAPWCGHCKNLAPVYEELATKFATAGDKVSVAKVDADEHKSLGKQFGVQGFPTIKWFDGKKGSKPEDYNGGRDLESLSKFIEEKTGVKGKTPKAAPSNVEMLNDATFKAQIGGDKDVLVAFTAPWCGRKFSQTNHFVVFHKADTKRERTSVTDHTDRFYSRLQNSCSNLGEACLRLRCRINCPDRQS